MSLRTTHEYRQLAQVKMAYLSNGVCVEYRKLPISRDWIMALIIRFLQSARGRIHSQEQTRVLSRSENYNYSLAVSSKRRLQIIRRDRSRCRGCDRKGDEITLEVYPIHPGAHDTYELLALCTNCRSIANDRHIASDHIPDFLRHLWRHLHHSGAGNQTDQIGMSTNAVMQPSSQGRPLRQASVMLSRENFGLDRR
jgi:hypothetical protein